MNRDVFEGNWKQLKGKIKQAWGDLTDDELDRVEGQYDEFVGLIQEKYGWEREEAERQIDRVLDSSWD